MSEATWLMRVERGLSAHFKQPNGEICRGTDWSIGLKRGDETHTVMVRAYLADDLAPVLRKDTEYQVRTAMQYLNDLLQQGWSPGQPRELAITIGNPTNAPAKKPFGNSGR